MKSLPDNYNPSEAEKRWQETWYQNDTYAWDESASREETFVIDTPPPTVSGTLHMGHIFSYTQADFIARYQRMAGKTVFYPMGFDDNGLPTERLVEKMKKVRATDMSREDFIKLCEGISAEARAEFRNLFKATALSVDWSQEYHTISEDSRRMSQLSFLDLFGKERVYRKLQPMLWDPVDQTAIAQAEVEDKELSSHFCDIHFAIEGSSEKIMIATTRPEMIPACVAIFYHPDDERYQHLKGKYALTPLFGIRVPIMTDDTVEPAKGTGIMMCCTFGDEADIEKWRRHDLPARLVLNKYGKMDLNGVWISDSSAKEALQGLKASVAREKIIEMLKESGDLLSAKPITHAVKCAERSGAPLELLPTYQWFVKLLDQKEPLKEKAAQCEWHPPYMKVRMDQWIDGLNWDWCISRQRYFGVPFPVWYSKRAGEEGKVLIASPDQLPVNPLVDLPHGYSREEVEAEADVMDTWATSSISPQISSGAITGKLGGDMVRHQKLFPADLRPQAHEIIRTWAFYTLVKAHLHEDSIPWKNLMISGWCLAADKSKMSKSKGNVVTPVGLIEDKGADVVRYWASTSRLGADTAFSEDVLKIGKKLVNKVWNATKFAAIHLTHLKEMPKTAKEEVESGIITEILDKWILTRLQRTIEKSTKDFDKYEYCDARVTIEEFFWKDFCDNYLELIKTRVYGNGCTQSQQMSAIHTIYHCLNAILKQLAPFIPHISEELFSYVFDKEYANKGSIHARGMWVRAADFPCEPKAEEAGIHCVALLEAVRKQKSERNVSIKYPLEKLVISTRKPYSDAAMLEACFADLKGAANAEIAEFGVMQEADNIPANVALSVTEDEVFTLYSVFAENADAA